MDFMLWIVAGLLSVIYLAAGAGKLVIPKEKLAAFPGGGWVDDFSAGAVKTIGALEVLAASAAASRTTNAQDVTAVRRRDTRIFQSLLEAGIVSVAGSDGCSSPYVRI